MSIKRFKYPLPFKLESGKKLNGIEVAYHTYGTLNKEKNNVVWVCHALTANSDCADWWSGLIGEEKIIDPQKYFIVCANILGSCYGSSGPLSINTRTNKKYYSNFPFITIRDMVNAHILLRKHLGIEQISIGIAGSMGGYQLLEWACTEKEIFKRMILLATGAKESAWGIAIHTAQRLAIETDETWKDLSDKAGAKGLKTARAIGMLTYRGYEAFVKAQTDKDENKTDAFKASSYIHYQGDKLVNRFNAYSYWLLTKAMDSHNLARGRGSIKKALKSISANTLIIGISSDLLCPISEQKFLAKYFKKAAYHQIDSDYGHDGFLIEWTKIGKAIKKFLNKE